MINDVNEATYHLDPFTDLAGLKPHDESTQNKLAQPPNPSLRFESIETSDKKDWKEIISMRKKVKRWNILVEE